MLQAYTCRTGIQEYKLQQAASLQDPGRLPRPTISTLVRITKNIQYVRYY